MGWVRNKALLLESTRRLNAAQVGLGEQPNHLALTCMMWAPARPGSEDERTLPFAMPEKHGR
jgi:hypothetical protein